MYVCVSCIYPPCMYVCMHNDAYRPASTFFVNYFDYFSHSFKYSCICLALLCVCVRACVCVPVWVFRLGHVLRLSPRHWGFMNRLQGRTNSSSRQGKAGCCCCLRSLSDRSQQLKLKMEQDIEMPCAIFHLFPVPYTLHSPHSHTHTQTLTLEPIILRMQSRRDRSSERQKDRQTDWLTEGTGNKTDRRAERAGGRSSRR